MTPGGAFRVRRVGEWLGVEGTENIQTTGGLAGGAGQYLTKSGYGSCYTLLATLLNYSKLGNLKI